MDKTQAPRFSNRRKIAILACFVSALVLSDEYLLPTVPKAEVVYDGHIKRKKRYGTAFILNAKSGKTYRVSKDAYKAVEADETFYVDQTFLFRRNVVFTVCRERCRSFYIGSMNQGYVFDFLIGAMLLLNFFIAAGIFKTEKYPYSQYVIFGIAFSVFVIYIIF